nr:MAG TPA: hypothetical protein [Caudoviricetes sp.]
MRFAYLVLIVFYLVMILIRFFFVSLQPRWILIEL